MKLTHLMILLFLICFAISPVIAAQTIDYSNNTTKITFQDVEFMIPEGYGQSKDVENFTELGSDGKTTFYANQLKHELVITVISDWMGMSLDDLKKDNATKTKINGYEGWNYTEDNLHYFAYVNDDKGILIGVTNETQIYDIVL